MSEELALAIVELQRDKVLDLVKSRSEKGESPLQILEECRQGMVTVGERFQTGEFFLAELILSAEIFKGVTAILEPQLAAERPPKPVGKIILLGPPWKANIDFHHIGFQLVVDEIIDSKIHGNKNPPLPLER